MRFWLKKSSNSHRHHHQSLPEWLSKLNSDSQLLHSKKGLDLSNLAIQRLKFSGIFQKLTLMCDLSQLHFFLMGMRERSDQTMRTLDCDSCEWLVAGTRRVFILFYFIITLENWNKKWHKFSVGSQIILSQILVI